MQNRYRNSESERRIATNSPERRDSSQNSKSKNGYSRSRGRKQNYRQSTSGRSTSWQKVAPWYSKLQGEKGDYFHKEIILPRVLKQLKSNERSTVLDLACGDGVLGRNLTRDNEYVGIDISESLIDQARKLDRNLKHQYHIADVSKNLAGVLPDSFKADFITVILALQNIRDTAALFRNASQYLKAGGLLIMVINHPYFRIPRYTGWGINEQNKTQYRWVNKYMSELEIPIDMTPGGRDTTRHKTTLSFHKPLSAYSAELGRAGFLIEQIEEWVSEKHSVGKAAKMENIARQEFPMFMSIVARS